MADGLGAVEFQANAALDAGGSAVERFDIEGGEAQRVVFDLGLGGDHDGLAIFQHVAAAVQHLGEAGDLEAAGLVAHGDPGHAAAGFGVALFSGGHCAGEFDASQARAGLLADCGAGDDTECAQRLFVFVQRMGGEVEAHRLGLEGQAVEHWPFLHLGQAQHGRALLHRAEEGDLGAGALFGHGLGAAQQGFGAGDEAGAAGAERIKGAGFGEVFELHFVEQARVHALGEIGHAVEGFLPCGDEVFHGLQADALDGGECEADFAMGAVGAIRGRFDGEFGGGAVDVGRQHLDAGA